MLSSNQPSLYHTNRAFCYGDALFETIHGNGTKLHFFDSHYKRLMKGMEVLGMNRYNFISKEGLEATLVKLLKKNKLYKGVRIRLSVFRNQGGLYAPADNSVSYLAEAMPLPADNFLLNEKGLKTGIFKELKKQADILSNLKTANSLLYIRAGMFARASGLDESIILNNRGNLAETTSSNIFLVKKGALSTPSLDEGCVAGVMRDQIISIALHEGIECVETEVTRDDLIQAEECFLTNAVSGIRWVVAFEQRRYYSKTAKFLTGLLNAIVS